MTRKVRIEAIRDRPIAAATTTPATVPLESLPSDEAEWPPVRPEEPAAVVLDVVGDCV